MSVAEKLRKFRLGAGLKQVDVAKKLNVDQSAVSCWERGKNMPAKKYRVKLAKMYFTTPDELFAECEKRGDS